MSHVSQRPRDAVAITQSYCDASPRQKVPTSLINVTPLSATSEDTWAARQDGLTNLDALQQPQIDKARSDQSSPGQPKSHTRFGYPQKLGLDDALPNRHYCP